LKNVISHGRRKRETEESEQVFQNGPVDYDELMQALNDDFPYMMRNAAEKRFLGELAVAV